MVKGAPDYTKITLLKGTDPTGALVTVALDTDGKIIAILQGQVGGVAKTVLTDADGRIQALLYGMYGPTPMAIAVDAGGKLVVQNLAQTNIEGDVTEAQTWDSSVSTLLNNLNRIRNQIVAITGEAWGTVSYNVAAIWAKFHATTGHKHTGAADDAPKIPDTSLESPVATHAALAASVHGVSASGFEDKTNKNASNGYAKINVTREIPHHINKIASENIRNSHDSVAGTPSGVPTLTKLKVITLPNGLIGQSTVYFEMKDYYGNGIAYGRVYRNENPIGTQQSTSSTAWVSFSENITQTFSPGDTIELWGYGSHYPYWQNFRLKYDDSPNISVDSENS